jgi:hypothetical protein
MAGPKASGKPKKKGTRKLTPWEVALRDDHFPKTLTRIEAIIRKFHAGDHNRGPTQVVHAYVEELLKELQQPTQSHSAQMLALMQEIAEIEPSISPDGKFLPIPPKPKAKDYDTAMRDWFADIEDLTWSIYQRLGGADSPTPPISHDPAGQIVEYAADIRRCIDGINPKLIAEHWRMFSKGPGGSPITRMPQTSGR